MAIQQVEKTTRVTATDTQEPIENDNLAPQTVHGSNLLAQIIGYVGGVLLVLLAFRFVLALLGANPSNGFANFIYSLSHPFVAPFFSLFGYNLRYGVARFETFTLVAMAVYAIVTYGLIRLVTLNHRPAATV